MKGLDRVLLTADECFLTPTTTTSTTTTTTTTVY